LKADSDQKDVKELRAIQNNESHLDLFWNSLAQAQAKSGLLSDALATLNSMQESSWKDRSIEGIASAMTREKQTAIALSWARSINVHREQSYALLGIAKGLMNDNRNSMGRSICDAY
jgi:predicted negative regulator of RcsB-dependent stress response